MPETVKSRLSVRVKPNARYNEIKGLDDNDVLTVAVAAPPVKGMANRELISFLCEAWDLRKSDVVIEKGATSRRKILLINGLSRAQLLQRLGAV